MKFFKINLHVWFNESVDILKAVDRSSWPDTEKSIICRGTVGVTILSPNIDTVVSLNTNNRANLRVNSKKENMTTHQQVSSTPAHCARKILSRLENRRGQGIQKDSTFSLVSTAYINCRFLSELHSPHLVHCNKDKVARPRWTSRSSVSSCEGETGWYTLKNSKFSRKSKLRNCLWSYDERKGASRR